ncbi:MAG: Gfo/Idh/MocA family oxidoreductase, partial [bacterium]|nr:Gfo/Idh/MocA family oxidoreductase [bacterium]
APAPGGTIWDFALPATLFADYLEPLPDGSPVLIQKPMGEDIAEAHRILEVCRRKGLRAAINFQLRFAPFVMAAKHLIDTGVIGDLLDMEIRATIHTPWDHFPFLQNVPRLEIVYHSIHHIDCIRHFLGDPLGVHAKTLRHPDLPDLPESRSSIILDYGERARANIQTNHFHKFGAKHQESYIKWEGSKGAIKATMGLLMNYPSGVPDRFEYCQLDAGGSPGEWREVTLEGSWFPEAFAGSMAQVMRHVEGTLENMPTSGEDAIRTMACVEAAYTSSDQGGVPINQYLEGEH